MRLRDAVKRVRGLIDEASIAVAREKPDPGEIHVDDLDVEALRLVVDEIVSLHTAAENIVRLAFGVDHRPIDPSTCEHRAVTYTREGGTCDVCGKPL